MSTRKNICDINASDVGTVFYIPCKVVDIFQTSGPTIFRLEDGTGTLKAVKFAKGKRAYPELDIGYYLCAQLKISEHDGKVESVFEGYTEIQDATKDALERRLQEKVARLVEPDQTEFLIQSEALEKLKSRFISLTRTIKKAILDGRPIIVRHHADCDGFSAGYALERAILPLIIHKHGEKGVRTFYKRAPSKTPYYDYYDATKDIAFFLTDAHRNKVPPPLILLLDHGGTPENVRSIKKVRLFDAHVAVVDHHDPGKLIDGGAAIDYFVTDHINTHLVGAGNILCAGMLCTELARFINKAVDDLSHIPALAGVADRCEGHEMDQYLGLAAQKGLGDESLRRLARCIDHETFYLGYLEAREMISFLLGPDSSKRRELVDMIYDEVEEKAHAHIATIKKYIEVHRMESINVGVIEIDKTTFRGDYISSSKTCRIAFNIVTERDPEIPVVVLGVSPDRITFRASQGLHMADGSAFDLNVLAEQMQRELPHALVDGGGHAVAGTLRFVQAAHDEVYEFVMNYLKMVR